MLKTVIFILLGVGALSSAGTTFIQSLLDAPVVYLSNSETKKMGEPICAFVETKKGKEPCRAYSYASRQKMAQRWAE